MRHIAWLTLVLSGATLSSSCVIVRGELRTESADASTDAHGDANLDAAADAASLDAASLDAASPDAELDAYGPDVYGPDVYGPDAYGPDVYTPELVDAYAPPDAYAAPDAPPDAFIPPDAYTAPDAFVCSGYVVYGQCVTGLRLWLDAADTSGVGEGGTVSRWTNRARSSPTGDATRPSSEAVVTYTATNGGAVVLGAGRLRTERDISVDHSTHFEVFIAATSRSMTDGYIFETDGSVTPRLSAHLPWTDPGQPTRAYFDIPRIDAATRIQTPFVPQAIWHAYRGTSGSALFVNNAPAVASGTLTERDSRQKLWIGGADRTGVRNQLNLHELIIFNEPISDGARAAIRSGMQARWFPSL